MSAMIFASHYVVLVPVNRAVEASGWLNNLFGTQEILHLWRSAAMEETYVYLRTIYLSVPHTRVVIVVQEAIREPHEENLSYSTMYLYMTNIEVLFHQIIHGDIHHRAPDIRRDHRALHQVRDPNGFYWSIVSRNTLPQNIFPLPLNPPQGIVNAHFVLRVPYPQFTRAVRWFVTRFRAVQLLDQNLMTAHGVVDRFAEREFLRLGLEPRSLIMKIIDATNRPEEVNHSNEFLNIYTQNMQRFRHSVTAPNGANVNVGGVGVIVHGIAAQVLAEGEHEDNSFMRIRDPFGFNWLILSANQIPSEVLEHQNNAVI